MGICLGMIVKNEEELIRACLESVLPLINSWVILDTGSIDRTPSMIAKTLKGVSGELVEHEWQSYGTARTALLEATREQEEWTLMLDGDMTVETHPAWPEWFASDPDPNVAAWLVPIVDNGRSHLLPLLTRGGLEWHYEGAVHEYLAPARPRRSLHVAERGGMTITHRGAGRKTQEAYEQDRELLRPGVVAGEPRAVFYMARTLDCLGRKDEALVMYERRAMMGDFEEEAWYAAFSAALLRGDVDRLLDCHRRRPWRPEPLRAAAAIVAKRPNDDILFREP
jgi:glycosyltransferase involved in cell wall biosynthesis